MPGPRILTMYGWKGTRSHQDQARSPSAYGEASILGRKALAMGQTRPLLAASKALSVAQGSVQLDAAQLIEPTFRTLESDDVLVITALGQRCASLFSVPPNAKILDYFPTMPSSLTPTSSSPTAATEAQRRRCGMASRSCGLVRNTQETVREVLGDGKWTRRSMELGEEAEEIDIVWGDCRSN